MKKYIFFTLPFLAALVLGIIMTGFYPVAVVDSSPVFFRTWKIAEDAAKRFFNVQAHTTRSKPIDFSLPESADLLLSVKRDTLTFLIEDRVILQKGGELFKNFEEAAKSRVLAALSAKGALRSQGALVYGLSEEDFMELVLLPQARRDVIRESLAKEGDFESQLREMKKGKSIKLYFVPFRWDGESVR